MTSSASVALLATLDTKAEEAAFVAEQLRALGYDPLVIDIGTAGIAQLPAGIDRAAVANAAGIAVEELAREEKRLAMEHVARGATALLLAALERGEISGVLAIGGGQGTWLAATVMRALPLGVPKVIVTTIAARAPLHVGASDIVIIPSVTDIAGLNRILTPILAGAAGAIVGMIGGRKLSTEASRTLVAMTMFGVTTAGGDEVPRLLAASGNEVAVFHANGTGGQVLESLVRDGTVHAVLDFTTTELVDELVGGIATAGPGRLEAAHDAGIPMLFVPGALDVINFGPPQTVPTSFANRRFSQHTPLATLMRTSVAEMRELARIVAGKLAKPTGPVAVLIPAGGFSALDAPGQPFFDPEADEAFTTTLRESLDPEIVVTVDRHHINDPQFAKVAAERFLALTRSRTTPSA